MISQSEYHPYYMPYLEKATEADSIVESLTINLNSVSHFYNAMPPEKHEFRYIEGKWTPKDILLHLLDTERIFAYRALRIARQDQTELVGFEQDDYVRFGKANKRSMSDLIAEYKSVRQASITLFNSFSETDLQTTGKASGSYISVRAIGLILTGHENHHNQIIKEHYL